VRKNFFGVFAAHRNAIQHLVIEVRTTGMLIYWKPECQYQVLMEEKLVKLELGFSIQLVSEVPCTKEVGIRKDQKNYCSLSKQQLRSYCSHMIQ
jgi:hypothetical protein